MVVVKPTQQDYDSRPPVEGEMEVPETMARQGVTHHNVRYVLMISLGVAIVALVLAYFVFFPR